MRRRTSSTVAAHLDRSGRVHERTRGGRSGGWSAPGRRGSAAVPAHRSGHRPIRQRHGVLRPARPHHRRGLTRRRRHRGHYRPSRHTPRAALSHHRDPAHRTTLHRTFRKPEPSCTSSISTPAPHSATSTYPPQGPPVCSNSVHCNARRADGHCNRSPHNSTLISPASPRQPASASNDSSAPEPPPGITSRRCLNASHTPVGSVGSRPVTCWPRERLPDRVAPADLGLVEGTVRQRPTPPRLTAAGSRRRPLLPDGH